MTKKSKDFIPLSFENAKRLLIKDEYAWLRVTYFSFGNSSKIYHLRIDEVCNEGIRVDVIKGTHALPYNTYGECWQIYKESR